nr:mfs-type transporter [Quercus suber]
MSDADVEKQSGELDHETAQPVSNGSSISEEKGALDERSKGFIALIMLALSLSALDVTIVTTALPTIAEHFHSSAGYTWIGSAYLLASAASTPLWGKISDIFGRKPILLLANFVFFVGSLIAALSINIGMLITARALQGIGGGGLLVLVDIVICDLFSQRTRGAYLGVIGGTWALALAVGPVIGGVFTQKVTWRWCFYINLPLDGLAFIIILLFLKVDTPRTPIIAGLRAIDWLGNFTIVGGTLLFLFGLQYGGVTFPWGSATVICLLVFGILLCFAFLLIEWKFAEYPIIPLRIFKYRSNSAALASVFFHGLAFIGPFYYLPLFFQSVRGATPLLSGVYILPIALGLGAAAMSTGAFIGITGLYRPPIYFGWLLTILGFGLFIDLNENSSWAKLIIYQIIAGVGVGPIFQAPLVALLTQVAQSDVATATATFNFLRTLATAIGIIVGQVVYQNQLVSDQPRLIASLGADGAAQLGGADASANTQVINSLPGPQRDVARSVFADALQPAWIMYTCFAVAGLLCALFIQQKTLSTEHTVTKTGLEAEKEAAARRQAEKEAKMQRQNEQV